MTGKRISITVLLMISAIMAIVAFQTFWICKQFQEEEATLRIRTNAIFRNLAYQMQAEVLKSSVTRISPDSTGNAVSKKNGKYSSEGSKVSPGSNGYKDSGFGGGLTQSGGVQVPEVIISQPNEIENRGLPQNFTGFFGNLRVESPLDSLKAREANANSAVTGGRTLVDTFHKFFFLSQMMEDGSIRNLLQLADSLKDTVDVGALQHLFRAALDKEALHVGFALHKESAKEQKSEQLSDPTLSNEVILGYTKPYILRYELQNSIGYIAQKLSTQIGLSVFLIALTSLSFVMLYRSLAKQRKLSAMRNDLISNITHELKTPIATVSVAIEALKNFHAIDDRHRTAEYLDISNNELQRLSLLVDKVLRLSMFEKQQLELSYETFDLIKLTGEIIASMRLQFDKYKARVQLLSDEEVLQISADRMHITSVIFNLLDNALKYSSRNPEITVKISRNEKGVQLVVSDNGIGIPDVYQKKIFDKFFRVPSGNRHDVKGYGLGLSYVQQVVQKHKGSIDVVSEPAKGSSFIIQLPDKP